MTIFEQVKSEQNISQGNEYYSAHLWLGEKNNISEVIFCEEFVSKKPP
jgi:hypothetical protein